MKLQNVRLNIYLIKRSSFDRSFFCLFLKCGKAQSFNEYEIKNAFQISRTYYSVFNQNMITISVEEIEYMSLHKNTDH